MTPPAPVTERRRRGLRSRLAQNAELDRDPTRTITLRRSYRVAHHKRFRWLKGAVREGVARADALGLKQDPEPRPVLQERSPAVRETLALLRSRVRDAQRDGDFERARRVLRAFISTSRSRNVAGVLATSSRFNFPTSAEKLDAFSGWLSEAVDAGIMEVELDDAGEIVERAGWQQTYVNRAYAKGVSSADMKLRRAGADVSPRFDDVQRTLQLPVHSEKLKLLYSRNLEELRGVTEAMSQSMRRELSNGLAQGFNPRRTASVINGRVGAIGLHRSRLIARTETIRAHAEATLTRFEQHGVKEVAGKAELATAGDSRVCPICIGLEGEVMPIKEARGVIPVHPMCRCTWLPVVDGGGRGTSTTTSAPIVPRDASRGEFQKDVVPGSSSVSAGRRLKEMPDETVARAALQASDELPDAPDFDKGSFGRIHARLMGLRDEAPSGKLGYGTVADEDMDALGFIKWDGRVRVRESMAEGAEDFAAAVREGGAVGPDEIRGMKTFIHETNHARSGIRFAEDAADQYTNQAGRFIEEGLTEWKSRNTIRHMLQEADVDVEGVPGLRNVDDIDHWNVTSVPGSYPRETDLIGNVAMREGVEAVDELYALETTEERLERLGQLMDAQLEMDLRQAVQEFTGLDGDSLNDAIATVSDIVRSADDEMKGRVSVALWDEIGSAAQPKTTPQFRSALIDLGGRDAIDFEL